MSKIFSFIFDMFSDPLTLPIEPWKEWLIIGIIGVIAQIVAFIIVGNMYGSGKICGSLAGSIFHWIIRLLILVPIWFVVYWVIVIGQWIVSHPFVALGIAGGTLIFAVTTCLICYYIRKIRKS